MNRRYITIPLLLCVSGWLISLFVAALYAACIPFGSFHEVPSSASSVVRTARNGTAYNFESAARWGWTRVFCTMEQEPAQWYSERTSTATGFANRKAATPWSDPSVPRWALLPHYDINAGIADGFGFPRTCLSRHFCQKVGDPKASYYQCVVLDKYNNLVLPTRLHVTGSIVNGIAVGLLLGGALLAIRCQRTWRAHCRFVKSRCMQCGYALDGLARTTSCPECGNRSERMTSRSRAV